MNTDFPERSVFMGSGFAGFARAPE